MSYDPEGIIRSYAENVEIEDQAEKYLSLRTEIPREYIKRYINPYCRIAFRLLEESYQQAWQAGYVLTTQQTITFALSVSP